MITEVTLRLLPPQHVASTVVATFDSVEAAANAVVTITGKMRPSMLEFMDSTSINAVEDKLRMGLDRTAAAMMVAGDRRPRARQASRTPSSWPRCSPNTVRKKCFRRRTRTRARPSSRPADSRSPRWRQGLAAARGRRRAAARAGRSGQRRGEDRREPRPDDLGDRARRRRQHPPADRVRPRRCRDERSAPTRRSARSWTWPSASAARSPASTASAG